MHHNVQLLCFGVYLLLSFPFLCTSSHSLGQHTTIRGTSRALSRARILSPNRQYFALSNSYLSRATSYPVIPVANSLKRRTASHSTSCTSSSDDSQNWTLACITWNLQEMTPSLDDCKFLRKFRSKDLIVVGVQECEHLRPRRHEGRRSRALRRQLDITLGRSSGQARGGV